MNTNDFKTRTEIIEEQSTCPEGYWVLGLDTGYSSVKGKSPNKRFAFPYYAKKVPEGRAFLREAEDSDIRYRDETGEWVVGKLAYDEVNAKEIVDSEQELTGRHRFFTDIFRVTTRTGIALGLMPNKYGSCEDKHIMIEAGLPPKYINDAVDLREALCGKHDFEVKVGAGNWIKYSIELKENDIQVMPQPLGSLVSASTNANGRQLKTAIQYWSGNVIVFDPGYGTLDTYIVKRGQVIGKGETCPEYGMHEVFARTCRDIEKEFGLSIEVPELQNCLESGEVKVIVSRRPLKTRKYSFKDILEKNCVEVCKEVIERLSSIYNYFVDYDYIIATGGTFEAWKDVFINAFKDVEDLRVIPANINNVSVSTVYSNVNGYYYYLSNMLGRSKTA